jgi:hypothetical protein
VASGCWHSSASAPCPVRGLRSQAPPGHRAGATRASSPLAVADVASASSDGARVTRMYWHLASYVKPPGAPGDRGWCGGRPRRPGGDETPCLVGDCGRGDCGGTAPAGACTERVAANDRRPAFSDGPSPGSPERLVISDHHPSAAHEVVASGPRRGHVKPESRSEPRHPESAHHRCRAQSAREHRQWPR